MTRLAAHIFQYVYENLRPAFRRASILIGAVVKKRRDETAEEEKVGCMNLYAVIARHLCTCRSIAEPMNTLFYLYFSKRIDGSLFNFPTFVKPDTIGYCGLHINLTACLMHCISKFFVARNITVIRETKTALKECVVWSYGCKSCDDGSYAAIGEIQ